MLIIRKAEIKDLDFLVKIDLKDEGYTKADNDILSKEDLDIHREKIIKFITDNDNFVFIYEDTEFEKNIGMIMFRFRNFDNETCLENDYDIALFKIIKETNISLNKPFCEVFQLWVNPDYRRRKLATNLKIKMEDEACKNNIGLLYTHTEKENTNVIELNKKLGYKILRTGPIWDQVVRVSLIKYIN